MSFSEPRLRANRKRFATGSVESFDASKGRGIIRARDGVALEFTVEKLRKVGRSTINVGVRVTVTYRMNNPTWVVRFWRIDGQGVVLIRA